MLAKSASNIPLPLRPARRFANPLHPDVTIECSSSPIEFEFQQVLPWKSPVSATTVVRSFSWFNELMIFVFFDWGSLMVAVGIYACARVEMKNFGVSLTQVLHKHWYLIVSYDSVERGDWLSRGFPERPERLARTTSNRNARRKGSRRMK